MPFPLRRTALAAGLFSLGSCITAPEPASGPRAEGLQLLMNNTCVTTRDLDGYHSTSKAEFVVTSVREGKDGWVSATAIPRNQAYMDNFYYNEKTGEQICGSQNFTNKGYTFIPK